LYRRGHHLDTHTFESVVESPPAEDYRRCCDIDQARDQHPVPQYHPPLGNGDDSHGRTISHTSIDLNYIPKATTAEPRTKPRPGCLDPTIDQSTQGPCFLSSCTFTPMPPGVNTLRLLLIKITVHSADKHILTGQILTGVNAGLANPQAQSRPIDTSHTPSSSPPSSALGLASYMDSTQHTYK